MNHIMVRIISSINLQNKVSLSSPHIHTSPIAGTWVGFDDYGINSTAVDITSIQRAF